MTDQRQHQNQQQADDADRNLEERVHLQRVMPRGDIARQQKAAEAHAAHERAEQHANRYRGGADEQLQHLEPDDLVYQRRAAAADEQQQQHRQPLFRRLGVGRLYLDAVYLLHLSLLSRQIRPASTSARWSARLPVFCAICSRQLNPSVTMTVPGSAARTAGSKHALAERLRHGVALLLEPERAGHAAASRVEHLHLAACRIQHRHLILHVEDGAVMTVHVDQHLLLSLRRHVIGRALCQKLAQQHRLPFQLRRPRVVGHQIRRLHP